MKKVLFLILFLCTVFSCNNNPSSFELESKLPGPFLFIDGSRMSTPDEWPLRRAEIAGQAQEYEFGVKPGPPSSVTGSFSENTITVTCSEGGETISFSCPITYPGAGSAPYPGMIGIGISLS